MGFEKVALDEEHEERVDFLERVEDPQEVSRVSMGCYSEEVAEGRREEGGKLLFGEKFEKGWFGSIKCAG